MSNDTTQANPFEEEKTSEKYSTIDAVYEASSEQAVEFVKPEAGLKVVDLGAGTGVSSSKILAAGATDLSLAEPSSAMLDKAKEKFGDKVNYVQTGAEDLVKHFEENIDLLYAMNCIHLFPDITKAFASI